MLPIKRPHDFAILWKLLSNERVSLDEARKKIFKWVEEVNDDTILHSFEFLSRAFFDSREKLANPKLVEFEEDTVRGSELTTCLSVPVRKHTREEEVTLNPRGCTRSKSISTSEARWMRGRLHGTLLEKKKRIRRLSSFSCSVSS
ncbi:hypothetical protein CR205_03025 [Alteribacter lacisalsi]|uniref:DUF8090 domain-containing protein n=2 Tax=Alteribacter lacisalsi TaxID=2045244 RepID=A0A2W0HKH1_9BACI|nr:hypothetical protein CR205_03025 [Alteribacter lacisalsi]